jgi:DNA polymerase I-like protein with 3'-5' exonuclease and polymerase domains
MVEPQCNDLVSPKADARRKIIRELLTPYTTGKRDRTVIAHYARIAPGPDGLIHTEPNFIGTSTCRWSSSEYKFGKEAATNLQNLTKKVAEYDRLYRLRDCLVAPDGYWLWASDYVGAEALLAAGYQGDWKFFDILMAGRNVHAWHASLVWGFPENEVKKLHKAHYVVAKNIGYGGQYKASLWKLLETVNANAEQLGRRFTEKEVSEWYAKIAALHPWEKWWAATVQELIDNMGSTRNCFGFRRTFFIPDEEKQLKEALANYPQSTVAWLIDEALWEINETLDVEGRFEIRMQIHDEILGIVRKDLLDQYMPQVMEIMERPFMLNGREIHIPADVSYGPNWGNMKKWKR